MAQVPLQYNPPAVCNQVLLTPLSLDTNTRGKYLLKRIISIQFLSNLLVWSMKYYADNLTAEGPEYKAELSWLDLLWESKSHEYSPDDLNPVFAMAQN